MKFTKPSIEIEKFENLDIVLAMSVIVNPTGDSTIDVDHPTHGGSDFGL